MTALVYGHYDARGASDDKGNVLLPLAAARSLRGSARGLGIGLKFLIEGEEEMGSPHLQRVLAEHRRLLACDAAFCADGGMHGETSCSIGISARGGFRLGIVLGGAAADAHSGLVCGAVRNPIHELAVLLASLHEADGSVAVEGFYDGVRALSPEERRELAGNGFDEAAFTASFGPIHGEPGYSTPERIGTRPAIDVVAIHSGRGAGSEEACGPGACVEEAAGPLVCAKARAAIMCRTVADQDPWIVRELVKKHLRERLPAGMSCEFEDSLCFWDYRIPERLPALAAARKALEEVYGSKARLRREGGGLPLRSFQEILGVSPVVFAFSREAEGAQGPDEDFLLEGMARGLASWTRLFEILAGRS
jgi:acetylornithine deacetylase/succinyl-diaminopimelate desuccinylase-like protein